jgi:phosphopantetheine--protein transferase-like protein
MPFLNLHSDQTMIVSDAIGVLLKQTEHLDHYGLKPEEQGRYLGFSSQKRQHEYAASRHLAKRCLAEFTNTNPSDWRIQNSANGAALAVNIRQHSHESLWLSLTHHGDYCAVAVSQQRIGIDLQGIEPLQRWEKIRTSVFSDQELQAIHLLNPNQRQTRFTELWALKEAYGKFRGTGLRPKADQRISFQATVFQNTMDGITLQLTDHVFAVVAEDIQSIRSGMAEQEQCPTYWQLDR